MYVHRPDARIFYQVTGSGTRDLLLLPQCQVVTYSRMWKHQIPYLSRYFRVITMDPRGNGRSDRPATGYDLDTRYGDLEAVLDEVRGRPSPSWRSRARPRSRSATRSPIPTGSRT
jgi:pimeloyl-ACP methyl ester carboxylesterase